MTAARRESDTSFVRIEQEFEAPREQIFDAWVQKQLLEGWLAPDDCTLYIARLDVREGGGYHWCIKNPSCGECWTIGSYLEVRRPERLVTTATIADERGIPRTPKSQGHDPAWPREYDHPRHLHKTRRANHRELEQDVSEQLAKRTGAHPSWLQMLNRLRRQLAGAAL